MIDFLFTLKSFFWALSTKFITGFIKGCAIYDILYIHSELSMMAFLYIYSYISMNTLYVVGRKNILRCIQMRGMHKLCTLSSLFPTQTKKYLNDIKRWCELDLVSLSHKNNNVQAYKYNQQDNHLDLIILSSVTDLGLYHQKTPKKFETSTQRARLFQLFQLLATRSCRRLSNT